MQLPLFDTNKTGINCNLCGNDPGLKKGSENMWNGFLDMDVKKYVCFNCQTAHYQEKNKGAFAHQYSEFPVMANLPQKYNVNKNLTHA